MVLVSLLRLGVLPLQNKVFSSHSSLLGMDEAISAFSQINQSTAFLAAKAFLIAWWRCIHLGGERNTWSWKRNFPHPFFQFYFFYTFGRHMLLVEICDQYSRRPRELEAEAEMERIRRDREQEAASTSEKRWVFSQLTFILCGSSLTLAHPYI